MKDQVCGLAHFTIPSAHVQKYSYIHPEMLYVTSRLAVKVKYIPSWEVDWKDATPQKSRSELTIDDLIPNEADGEEMFARAVQYVMRFMVTHYKAFAHLKNKVLPLKSPYPVKKWHR